MSEEENVIDLASRRPSRGARMPDDIDTLRFTQMQRDFYEVQVVHLRRVVRAMGILALTGYALGIFCGYFVALQVFLAR